MKKQSVLLSTMVLMVALSGCATATQPAATEAPLWNNQSYEAPAPTVAVSAPNNGMDNYFEDYGVNPKTSTRKDFLSTFALDVDTASYQITRSYIENGSLPPIDAVRAEEFINAFDQGYAAPKTDPFAIYADGALSPFADGGNYLMRVGIQGYRVPNAERKPLRLTFVVDTSGSMSSENRLELVKDSLEMLVERMDERDEVAIVGFESTSYSVLRPTNAAETRAIDRALKGLQPGSSTNVDEGLRMGYSVADHMYCDECENRVILLTDGVANTGETDVNDLLRFVNRYASSGITLTGIGVGMGNYNDVLLEQLADNGNGNYYYFDTLDEARERFVEKFVSTMQVIAYDAKVQVEFNPEVVASYRMIGYENRQLEDSDFRDDSVDAGEIGAGMSATALYEVKLKPGTDGRIATIKLRWEDANTRQITEKDTDFFSADLAPAFSKASPYFQRTAVIAAYAEILRASPYVEGDLMDVYEQAQDLLDQFPEDEKYDDFVSMAFRSARLARGIE
jgi:Ca-activated chloride channel family protein